MKPILISLLLIATIAFFSCEKDMEGCHKSCTETTGVIHDLTSKLDGCGIVITLPNGIMLEPIQSPAGFTYIDGKTVSFCYEEKPHPSVCMTGPTVIIKNIHYLP